jgi:hypothetical protein
MVDFAICKYCLSFWDNISLYAGLIDTLCWVMMAYYLRKIAKREGSGT